MAAWVSSRIPVQKIRRQEPRQALAQPAPARIHPWAGASNWRDYDADTGRFTGLDPLREKGGDPDWYGYCVDDPVNRVDVWGLEWGWKDLFDPVQTAVQMGVEKALKVGKLASGALGVLTAPLGDLLFPDSLNDVEQETKEYWDKRNAKPVPEDLRDRH